MTLSNGEIRQTLKGFPLITPPPAERDIQPASIDVYINPDEIYIWDGGVMHSHDPNRDNKNWRRITPVWNAEGRRVVLLKPGLFYMMSTKEWVKIPWTMIGRLEGVSSMARLGFVCHQQAGLLDPEWEGNVTGECSVQVVLELTLEWPLNDEFREPRLGQITLARLGRGADPGYRGRYQRSKGTVFTRPDSPDWKRPPQG